MDYLYQQALDSRWTASGPVDQSVAQTFAGATALSQGLTPNLPTVSSDGACQGISMWWIIKRALGDNFWDWFGPSRKSSPSSSRTFPKSGEPVSKIKEVMQLQARLPGSRRTNHDAAVNYILAKTKGHLVRKRGMVLRTNQTFKSMAYEITAKRGYVFIGFYNHTWGGHAVAAHILRDGSMEFMDPNEGEWDFRSFKHFYSEIVNVGNTTYGGMKLDSVEIQTLERPGV